MLACIRIAKCFLFLCGVLTSVAACGGDPQPAVISSEQAKDYLGQPIAVELTVQIGREATGKCCFLDSEKDFTSPKNLVVFITSSALEKFNSQRGIESPGRYFFLHKLRVTGTVTQYRHTPEIQVDSPDQIEDLEAPTLMKATDAKNNIGKNAVVEFVVRKGKELPSTCCTLNADEELGSPNDFIVFINMTGLEKFRKNPLTAKPAEYFLNKKIRVLGTIIQFKRTPEIKVNSPDQITIVDDDKT